MTKTSFVGNNIYDIKAGKQDYRGIIMPCDNPTVVALHLYI